MAHLQHLTNQMTMVIQWVQVPAWLGHVDDPLAALLGAEAALGMVVLYCGYQVWYPEVQQRKNWRCQAEKVSPVHGCLILATLPPLPPPPPPPLLPPGLTLSPHTHPHSSLDTQVCMKHFCLDPS